MKPKPAWYVLQVLTGQECHIARKLADAGYPALAPAEVIHERRHGKWWPIRKTVFPSYVFVQIALRPKDYYYIRRLPHVLRFLGEGNPEAVPDDQMEIVLYLANNGKDFGLSEAEKIDGKTIIKAGPLLPLRDHVVKINHRNRRATLEVTLLDTTHRIDAGVILVQPAAAEDNQEEETGQGESDADPSL